MANVKRVALLLPSLKFGGAERVAVNLAKALAESGAGIDILLMSHEGEYLAEAIGCCRVVDLRCDRTYKLPGKLIMYLYSQHPDVLLSSFWKLNLCSCIARVFYWRVRLLLWEHSPPSKSQNSPRWLYAISSSLFYQIAHRVVTVSTGVRADIARWSIGLRRKLIVIFNPINPPPPQLLSSDCRTESQQIVWAGRLDSPKNPMLTLEAFALLPADMGYNLVFIGDGLLRSSLEKRCRELGLSGSVRFLGYHKQPYAIMAGSDLLVLSSDREGFGNVLIEALFCGLRVVATDCGEGIHDILLNNRYGTIVPTGDPVILASAIVQAMKSPCDKQMQIEGAQRFLPETIARQFLSIMSSEKA